MTSFFEQLITASQRIKVSAPPKLAIQLGTGLSHVFDSALEVETSIVYEELFSGGQPSALTHRGELSIGRLEGYPVAIFAGRIHLYENHTALEICQNVILAKLLGCEKFFFTNAAGALNSSYTPGQLMLITDHLNMSGENPLIGLPSNLVEHFSIEHPFVDMSQAYHPQINSQLADIARQNQLKLNQGVYAGLRGPSLETSAERRMLRTLGADAVGMSTVNEVIMSRYLEMETAAISTITNMATGGEEQKVDEIADIVAHAAIGGETILKLFVEYCDTLDS